MGSGCHEDGADGSFAIVFRIAGCGAAGVGNLEVIVLDGDAVRE